MALIKYGHIIAEARGKLNGTVFSRNSSGAYMRTKVTPANPQSAAQQNRRGAFTTLAQSWRALTDAQRASWNMQAPDFTRMNIFGDNVPLSGFNLYMRCNGNLQVAGITLLTDCPQPAAVVGLTALAVGALTATPTMTLTFAPTPVTADHTVLIFATSAQSAGKSFVKSEYRYITKVAAAGTSPANIQSAYTSKFGAQLEGDKIFFKAFVINNLTGIASVALQTSGVTAAA